MTYQLCIYIFHSYVDYSQVVFISIALCSRYATFSSGVICFFIVYHNTQIHQVFECMRVFEYSQQIFVLFLILFTDIQTINIYFEKNGIKSIFSILAFDVSLQCKVTGV